MPDDLTRKRPEDSKRINLGQEHEIQYWCDKFGCTRKQLRDAVKQVGDSAAIVQRYLTLR